MKMKEYRKNGIVISTIEVPFMAWYGEYETAISFDAERSWSIAEGYETAEQAQEGHLKYSKMDEKDLGRLEFIG